MSKMYGVVIGIVKDLDDPLGEARIRLQFPWMSEEELSGWAPITRPMAGKERGFYYMPELEDEALVAFEHGEFDHPFVLGFLHNGVDLPPDDDIDKQVRRLKTVCGHIMEFDDRGGKERILLKTKGEHLLEMKDPEGTIELKKGGLEIKMTDSPGQIKLKTAAGTSVTIDDSPSQIELKTVAGVSITISDTGGISMKAASGPVDINCLSATVTTSTSATVNASASCTINGSSVTVNGASVSINSGIATFSGVVQCTTLIATSVVSSAYTPGAGNLI